MEVGVLVHGFLGTLLLLGLVLSIWLAAFPARRSLLPLRAVLIASSAVVFAKNLLGSIVYITYRADTADSARSLILAGNRPWIHTILMEFKEHAAHFLLPIMLVAVLIAFVSDVRDKENSSARRTLLALLWLSLLITVVALFMGALITSTAPVR
jgi:hypothetical protein